MRLKNKLAVITGGSDGIGFGIAQAYGREGARLCLVARTAKSLSAAKAKLEAAGAAVSTVQADLVADDAVEHVAAAIKALGQPVDVLVNNAGMAALVPFMEATRAQYESSLRLNVTVPFFLTQAVVPSMAPGAAIINISSYFAHKMLPGRPSSIYSLTKGALNSLTKAMAWELAARDIRVNAIAPGTVDTPMRRKSIETLPQQAQDDLVQLVKRIYPLGRIGKIEDLGGIAVYLASDESAWTTGAVFAVDGGLTVG